MHVPLRIGVPLRPPSGDDGLLPNLAPRQPQEPPSEHQPTDNQQSHGPDSTVWIVVGVVAAVIVVVVLVCWFLRRRKASKRGKYHRTIDRESLHPPSTNERRRQYGSSEATSNANRSSSASRVDRHTSVRSIMTLPVYQTKPGENEQVLGREGERDGVDVVVEYPSAEHLESLRDEEMETMYQIRVTRRQQQAERSERRRLQTEARQRGDLVALEELRARRRAESEDTSIDNLRDNQIDVMQRRQRAVSSVSYHDIGVARHDGTRIRANSTESTDRVGLLSDAASISQSMRSPSAQSNRRISDAGSMLSQRSPSAQSHYRDRSGSYGASLEVDDNMDFPSPGLRSGATTPRLGSHHTRAGSSPEIIGEEDLADNGMPPPDYDDVSLDDVRSGATTPIRFDEPPPDYTDPSTERERRLSAHVADMMGESGDLSSPDEPISANSTRSSNRSSRGVGGAPQLPSLRIRGLPQIVIEPSTAQPSDHR
ncbi:hypothetical protein F5Y15DRAFT_288208 [Xylariaceae sp. FL0016]|nr:hypothetical protein F5Y15DRAFT_288208 [Xylariaceae sp. FL0016]